MIEHIKNHYNKYLMLIAAVMIFTAGVLARPTLSLMKHNFMDLFFPAPIVVVNIDPEEEGIRKIAESQGAKDICHLFAVNRYYAEKAEDARTKMLSYDRLGTDTSKEYNRKLDEFIFGINSDAEKKATSTVTSTKKK